MAGGRDVDVDVALAARRVAARALRAAAAGGARAEAERQERALLLQGQGELLRVRAHGRVGGRVLQRVRRRGARHERLGRRGVRRQRAGGRVVVVGEGHAAGYRLPVLQQTTHTLTIAPGLRGGEPPGSCDDTKGPGDKIQ